MRFYPAKASIPCDNLNRIAIVVREQRPDRGLRQSAQASETVFLQ